MCGREHRTLKYKRGDKVRALSMKPHILENNPFADPEVNRAGQVGVVVEATAWERIGKTLYLVNFNPDPDGAWHQAPFEECQLEMVS